VRDLRVQEFLRELIIGVAALDDLAVLILVEILYSGKGGNVKQVARISKQISRVCDCSSFSQLICAYILHTHNCSYLYMLNITCAQ